MRLLKMIIVMVFLNSVLVLSEEGTAGNHTIFDYIAMGSLEGVMSELQHRTAVDVRDSAYNTPLIYAARKNSQYIDKIVAHLLSLNANVHARNWDGFTPLMNALLYGRNDVVIKLLKKSGAILWEEDKKLLIQRFTEELIMYYQ